MSTLLASNNEVRTSTKVINLALWLAQGLLILAFGMAGVLKTTQPMAELATKMPWTTHFPAAMVRFIGTSEFLGAAGLLLPSVTRIRPFLTPLAASGLVVIMVLAAIFHGSHGEWNAVGFNFVLGGLAAFVALGRTRLVPIAPRA